MHRQSKVVNVTLKVKGNESRNTEEKEETSFSDLSKDQKICKVTESKATMASEKENLSDGSQMQLQKLTLKYSKVLEKESYHSRKDASCPLAECSFDTLKGDVVGEPSWPLNSKEKFSRSGPGSLGDECCLPPNRDKAEEKSCCGILEKQRRKTVDFATVTTAEFGITQESFTSPSIGKSPNALKLRRRSAIGVRGSPENNALIQYLAQQRSNRQKETFTQHASPFKLAKSSKNKINVFQTPLKSVQEAEGQMDFSGLSQASGASQEADCAQNKVPFTKKCSLDQQSEKSVSDYSGADLKENLKQNLTYGNKSDSKMCTVLSSHQDVTVTEPALSKEWAYKQHNPIEYSDAILIRDILETSHDFSPDHISKEVRSNVISDLHRKKVNFAELRLEIHDESKPPVTPLRMGSASLNEHTRSGSQLRSVLKKTPTKELTDCVKEYSADTVGSGGRESLTGSEVKICEALQTEKTEQYSSEKPKKKKVTFGEDLSPEIFDKTLPANTPLRKGATPVRHPGSQSNSPFTRSGLLEEPLSQPNFDCDDQCVEPLEELREDSVAAEDISPVENTTEVTAVAAESAYCLVKESDKSYTIATRSSTKRKSSTHSDGVDLSTPRATSTKNVKDTKNPRKNKLQRPKNITTSAAKKTQRTKHASSGKRRKRKVKKSLYGEREMASKKPLLSPIPEIPEVLSSASSPSSPKANALAEDAFLDSKSRNGQKDVQWKQAIEGMRGENIPAVHVCPISEDLDVVESRSPDVTVFQVSDGDLKSVSGPDHKFPSIVPDPNYVSDTHDCFQQAEETECLKEEKGSDFLIENKKLQGNFPNKEDWLTGLEFPEQDTGIHEILQNTGRPPKKSSRGRPRRRSSTVYIPPVEKFNFETIGNDLPLSFNVEEVLSAPQLKNNSSEGPFRRKKGSSSETSRVRRSMRLHKDAETEGLAWIPVPNEILKNPPPVASGCKTRRTISTSVLMESENIHHREENLIQFAAPGKENSDPVNLADGPCRRWRRKSTCASTPQETRTWSQTRKRSITNSVYSKDRRNQRHSEEAEIPVENQANT